MIKAYIVLLLVGGLAVVLPLGGGLIVAAVGTAGIAAGLTLIGVELRSPSR